MGVVKLCPPARGNQRNYQLPFTLLLLKNSLKSSIDAPGICIFLQSSNLIVTNTQKPMSHNAPPFSLVYFIISPNCSNTLDFNVTEENP